CRKHGYKAARRQEADAHMRAVRNHGCTRGREAAAPKRLGYDSTDHTVGRRQHPGLVRQILDVDPAPARPRVLRARRDDIRLVKERLEVETWVFDAAVAAHDQEIDLALCKLAAQRSDVAAGDVECHL